jgi:hypothetical protein
MATKRRPPARYAPERTPQEVARDWLGVQMLILVVVIVVPILFAMVR